MYLVDLCISSKVYWETCGYLLAGVVGCLSGPMLSSELLFEVDNSPSSPISKSAIMSGLFFFSLLAVPTTKTALSSSQATDSTSEGEVILLRI